MKISYFFSLLIFICFSLPLLAQLTPAQAIAEMGRGINLGNTLEPPAESANGFNTLDLSTLASGPYLLKLLGENVCLVKRIVIY